MGLYQSGRGLPALLVGSILARSLLLLQEATLRRTLRPKHLSRRDRRQLSRVDPGDTCVCTVLSSSSSAPASLAVNRKTSSQHSRGVGYLFTFAIDKIGCTSRPRSRYQIPRPLLFTSHQLMMSEIDFAPLPSPPVFLPTSRFHIVSLA